MRDCVENVFPTNPSQRDYKPSIVYVEINSIKVLNVLDVVYSELISIVGYVSTNLDGIFHVLDSLSKHL